MTFAPQRQEDCVMLNFEGVVLLTWLFLRAGPWTYKDVITLFQLFDKHDARIDILYIYFSNNTPLFHTDLLKP